MDFEEVKEVVLEVIDKCDTFDGLFEIIANKIYETGYQDAVKHIQNELILPY